MLSLLADALMLATRLEPLPRHQDGRGEVDWGSRFTSSRTPGADQTFRRFNTRADLNW